MYTSLNSPIIMMENTFRSNFPVYNTLHCKNTGRNIPRFIGGFDECVITS